MELPPFFTVSLLVIAVSSLYLLSKLHKNRSFMLNLRKQGLPMPQHNYVAGHLLALKAILDTHPSDAHKIYAFVKLSRQFKGAFYIDLWPFSEPFLMITSPFLANQATQTTVVSVEKPDVLRKWFFPLTGGTTLFDSKPEEWKPLRALFNPGFSSAHLMKMVPGMVHQITTFCNALRQHARSSEMVLLDPVILRLSMDVIGKIVLNADLGTQKGPNKLSDALLSQVSWKIANQETGISAWLNFARPLVERRNSWQMDSYINRELDKRFEYYKNSLREKVHSDKDFESVIDLALHDYMTDPARRVSDKLGKDFRTFALRNMRMFMFAGHDSTSSMICYCYYLLYTNATTLASIRAEHSSVFGSDLSALPSILSKDPYLINKLSYTDAVIKETMRLFPVASGLRQGLAGVDLVDEDGTRFPTENTNIWILHHEIHRDAKYWPRADEFLPERWLAAPGDALYPIKGAWRPFEFGPRNCIGQTLVMIEARIILAMTVREFDIMPAYGEWDEMNARNGVKAVEGERCYQTEKGAAHPVNNYPCRVSIGKPDRGLTTKGSFL